MIQVERPKYRTDQTCASCRFWEPWPPTPEPPVAGWCPKLSAGRNRNGHTGGRGIAIGLRSDEGQFIAQRDFGCIEWRPAITPAEGEPLP